MSDSQLTHKRAYVTIVVYTLVYKQMYMNLYNRRRILRTKLRTQTVLIFYKFAELRLNEISSNIIIPSPAYTMRIIIITNKAKL